MSSLDIISRFVAMIIIAIKKFFISPSINSNIYILIHKFRDTSSVQYTYSTIWDANKLKGCICDTGHAGFYCAERNCPVGDDPLTTGQSNEVQLVGCQAISGRFVFYYK